MTLGHNDKRTSAQQLMWVWNKISGFLKGLFSHIRRCRGIYSFLSGALSTLFILWAFIWYGVLAYPVPWKVIDPTDPRFDPSAFRLSDYEEGSGLATTLACLFPTGTTKAFVDKLLVDVAGARVKKFAIKNKDYYHPNEYEYSFSNFRQRVFHAVYGLIPEEESFTIRFNSANIIEASSFSKSQCHKGEKDE